MRRHLAILNIALLLLALYFPLFSPIASEAGSTSGVRYGFCATTPCIGSNADYADLMMVGGFSAQPLNSQGYPTTVGVLNYLSINFDGGYPSGNYQWYSEGSCTFTINCWEVIGGTRYGFNGITNQKTVKVNGKNITTALVNFTFPPLQPPAQTGASPNNFVILIGVTPTDANDPPANFHLMRPDVPAW